MSIRIPWFNRDGRSIGCFGFLVGATSLQDVAQIVVIRDLTWLRPESSDDQSDRKLRVALIGGHDAEKMQGFGMVGFAHKNVSTDVSGLCQPPKLVKRGRFCK